MSNKCVYCGESFEDSHYEYKGDSVCSKVCYNEMKFLNFSFLVSHCIGYLFIGIIFFSIAIFFMMLYTHSKGFVNMDKFIPYAITSFSLWIMSKIIAIIVQHPLEKPYKNITKLFSSYGIPYWIVLINHIYIYLYSINFLLFGHWNEDVIEDTVNIWGLKFNFFAANSLMLLSFVSLFILVIRVIDKLKVRLSITQSNEQTQ